MQHRVVVTLLGLLLLAAPASDRIYLAPLRAFEGVDASARVAVEERLLAAAQRRHRGVVGSSDLTALLDVEAATQAAGCDTDGCDAELADALGAPELLNAQLVRLGDTWVLSLTRLRRADMTVVARHQVTRPGQTPDVILPAVDELVDVVLGPIPSTMPTTGLATAAVGVVVTAIGGGLFGWGWERYLAGEKALATDPTTAFEIRRDWEWLTPTGTGVMILGGAIAVGGGALVGIDLLDGDNP